MGTVRPSGKSGKTAKKTKLGKKGKKTGQMNAGEGCNLPGIEGKVGEPYWLQTGQVMTQWEEAYGFPRKSFSSKASKGAKSGSRKIVNNDQYMVHCKQHGYVPDEVCIYTCIDGTLDTTMYCEKNPEDICVHGRDLTITKQCPLDFDSDAPFHDGKSLKQWWKEVLDRLYFKADEIFDGTSDEEIHLGHGAIVGALKTVNDEIDDIIARLAILDILLKKEEKEFNDIVPKDRKYTNDAIFYYSQLLEYPKDPFGS